MPGVTDHSQLSDAITCVLAVSTNGGHLAWDACPFSSSSRDKTPYEP